jgi:hypothetical protein
VVLVPPAPEEEDELEGLEAPAAADSAAPDA